MVMSYAKFFAVKTSCLIIAVFVMVSIANGEFIIDSIDNDTKAAQLFELHHHAKALERTKGFGDFLDDFLVKQGIGRKLRPKLGQTKKKPNVKPRIKALAKSETKVKQTPNGVMLKECIQQVLDFNENKRGREEKDTERQTDSPTDSPTIMKKKNINKKGRRRQDRKLENGDWEKDPADQFLDSSREIESDGDEYDKYDNNVDDGDMYGDTEYQLPSWLSGHTFEEMNRRLSTCHLPTERSNQVRTTELC